MSNLPPLVDDYSQVIANVKKFNEDLENGDYLWRKLRQFRRWYWVPEACVAGPSKFIGYQDMDEEQYEDRELRDNPSGANIDGRKTKTALSRWFEELTPGTPEHRFLEKWVTDMALTYKKLPNAIAKYHAPCGWKLTRTSQSS